jgi:hypothetical protein
MTLWENIAPETRIKTRERESCGRAFNTNPRSGIKYSFI